MNHGELISVSIRGAEQITFSTAITICEKLAKMYPSEANGCLRCATTISLIAKKRREGDGL